MLLCIGTSKGVVILDPDRSGPPLMALADPSPVWCMAQDSADANLLYAGSISNSQAGSARGRGSLARSSAGGPTCNNTTRETVRDDKIGAIAPPADSPGEVFIGTSN